MKYVALAMLIVSVAVLPSCKPARTGAIEVAVRDDTARPADATPAPDAGGTFRFADDAAGKILARTLTPKQVGEPLFLMPLPTAMQPWQSC